MERSIIIGIAGGSGSGKSTFTHNLVETFQDNVEIICHDSYYKSNDDLPYEERIKLNYDHPYSFDTELMIQDLEQLRMGKPIECPVYSFVEHTRMKKTVRILPKTVILIEGILIFENPTLREMMDMKIYIDTDPDIRLIRRLLRDVKERGRDLDSVITQYMSTVKPMHDEFVEPSKRYADIIVPEGGMNQVALDMIINKVDSILNKYK